MEEVCLQAASTHTVLLLHSSASKLWLPDRKVEQVVEETRAVRLALDRHNRKERRCEIAGAAALTRSISTCWAGLNKRVLQATGGGRAAPAAAGPQSTRRGQLADTGA